MTGIFEVEIETGREPCNRRHQVRGSRFAWHPRGPAACAGFAVSMEASSSRFQNRKMGKDAVCAVPTLRLLWYLENQTGRGGAGEQAALGVGDARFGGRGTAADIQRPAFGAHHAGVLGHALDEADLEFERG